MRVIITLLGAAIYIMALFYLLMGILGFSLRIGGKMYAEEGFGILRATYLMLFFLLVVGGLYYLWRFMHRVS